MTDSPKDPWDDKGWGPPTGGDARQAGGGHWGPPPLPPLVLGDVDPPLPPPEILQRYSARTLDPVEAVRLAGDDLRPTSYVGGSLLVPLSLLNDDELRVAAGEEAERLGHRLRPEGRSLRTATELSRYADREHGFDADFAVTVRMEATGAIGDPPDAWRLLQRLRSRLGRERVAPLGLDHVVPAIRPAHQGVGLGETGGAATAALTGYVLNGRTRVPAAVVLPPPARRPDDFFDESPADERPVVAVLDSGCGGHPWLDRAVVTEVRDAFGNVVGETDPATNPEVGGDVIGPLDGGLDWIAGHGTFAAGLVHQACPDATILSPRVLHADGVATEGDLNYALQQLLLLLLQFQNGQGGRRIDVVSLSLGYYHETAADALADGPLRRLLAAFGRRGVPVVAAAGNESTVRPMFPAAFAPHNGTTPPAGAVPVVSVGAENPDGTIALFSNSGEWVTTFAVGGLVLSTLPTTMNAGSDPPARLVDPPTGRPRADVDPDGYAGGFALWSGTSFSAPIVAGRIAAALLGASLDGDAPLEPGDRESTISRAWSAVTSVTGLRPER
jgi:serine protease